MLLWIALACPPSTTVNAADSAAEAWIVASPAFDPLSGTPFTWTIAGVEALTDVPGSVLAADGSMVRERVTSKGGWDGRDELGALSPTGEYSLRVGSGSSAAEWPFRVVRPGIVAAYAEADNGITAERVPLYWSLKRHSQAVTEPFSEVGTIDDDAGHRVDLPQLGESLVVPTDGAADPLAYTWDSRPILALTLAAVSTLGTPHLGDTELHLAIEGWTVLDDAPLADGVTVTLQRNEPLGTTLGVTEETLSVQVLAVDAEGTRWPVSSLPLPWRVYRLLAGSTWEEEGERYDPWVDAVDPALRALEGTVPERNAALDALVRWVFEDSGLAYDTQYGASAYTTYVRNDWERANFDMTSFLSRKYGVVINCTDCAGIMVAFGNMIGAEVDYAIIGWNFDLNYILAIGGSEFDPCPFGPSGCGFTYHAVTTDLENDLIWDATLALDGDDDPGSTPNTALLVQSIPADDYLFRLAKSQADYAYQAQGTLQ